MYLCICKAVSDQQIRQAIREGVRTVGEVSARFGVGTECGKCLDSIGEYIDACLAAPSAVSDPAPALALPAITHPAPSAAATDTAPTQTAWFAIDL